MIVSLRIYDDYLYTHKMNIANNNSFNIKSENFTIYTIEPAPEFLHRVISIYLSHRFPPKIIPEVDIVFISDLKHISGQHYLEQPKSMLHRKLNKIFHESTSQDFEYKWLPDSFKDL